MVRLSLKYAKSLLILVILFSSALFGWLCLNQKNHARLLVELNSENIPVVHLDIQGQLLPLTINLGSKFPLALNKEVLSQMKKKSLGNLSVRNLRGEENFISTYQIPHFNIGAFKFDHVLAIEEEGVGSIGRFIGDNHNLLLDIANSTIVLCDDSTYVEKIGYFLKSMVKIDKEMSRIGPCISVHTEKGVLKLVLSTSSPFSLIKFSRINTQVPWISWLSINGKDFGSQQFHPFAISSELEEVDGILGMDFIKNHVIYIDNQKEVIFIE